LRLGTQDQNLHSHSSVRQAVTIPAEASQVTLEFWTHTWSEPDAGADYQEAALLRPDGALIASLWRGQANDRGWVLRTTPLIGYAGDTVVLYFNVYNDGVGGRTAMFLDDVRLLACDQVESAEAPPGPAVGLTPAIPGPTALAAPEQTPLPEMTRVALAPTAPAAPTLYPPPTPIAPPPTPAPDLLSRLGNRFFGRLPAGSQVAALGSIVLLALLVAAGIAFRGRDKRD
jgi:hypothetical protein